MHLNNPINLETPITFKSGWHHYMVYTLEPVPNYPHGPAVSLTYKSSRDDIWHIQTWLIEKLPQSLQRVIKTGNLDPLEALVDSLEMVKQDCSGSPEYAE